MKVRYFFGETMSQITYETTEVERNLRRVFNIHLHKMDNQYALAMEKQICFEDISKKHLNNAIEIEQEINFARQVLLECFGIDLKLVDYDNETKTRVGRINYQGRK